MENVAPRDVVTDAVLTTLSEGRRDRFKRSHVQENMTHEVGEMTIIRAFRALDALGWIVSREGTIYYRPGPKAVAYLSAYPPPFGGEKYR